MITNTVLTTNATSIFTSASDNGDAVSCIYFCNTSATQVTINVYAVPAGHSASTSNIIYDQVVISGKDTFVCDMEKLFLDNGDSVQALCNTAPVVAATVSSIGY